MTTKTKVAKLSERGFSDLSQLALNLRIHRTAAELTQADMAKKFGINDHTLSGLEKGNKSPTYEVLSKMADEMNLEQVGQLFTPIKQIKPWVRFKQDKSVLDTKAKA